MSQTLGDAIAAALPELQAQAESMMTDTCRVTRLGAAEWVTGADGIERPPGPVTVYEGQCKVQTFQPYEQTPEVGGSMEVVQRYNLHLPVSAGPFQVGDLIERTTPGKPARHWRVGGLHEKTHQTSQRLLVDEGGPR